MSDSQTDLRILQRQFHARLLEIPNRRAITAAKRIASDLFPIDNTTDRLGWEDGN